MGIQPGNGCNALGTGHWSEKLAERPLPDCLSGGATIAVGRRPSQTTRNKIDCGCVMLAIKDQPEGGFRVTRGEPWWVKSETPRRAISFTNLQVYVLVAYAFTHAAWVGWPILNNRGLTMI